MAVSMNENERLLFFVYCKVKDAVESLANATQEGREWDVASPQTEEVRNRGWSPRHAVDGPPRYICLPGLCPLSSRAGEEKDIVGSFETPTPRMASIR